MSEAASLQQAAADAPARDLAGRVAALDQGALATALEAQGHAVLPALLTVAECDAVARLYDMPGLFRSQVVMARHGYGQGEYRYFAYPLPPAVTALRQALYSLLAPVANLWSETLRIATRYPLDHASFLDLCHRAGQRRPTPLLLRYRAGDYNRLHQDIYGEHAFPLQATVLLARPGEDFTGGEFVLIEQRVRMQSRAEIVPLSQGDAVIFAVNQRPVPSARGFARATMRHGVSRLRSGERTTLGIIFHDAR